MVRFRDGEDDYGLPPEETAPPPETPTPTPPPPEEPTPTTTPDGERMPVVPPPPRPPPIVVPFRDPVLPLPPGPRPGPTPPPSLRPHSPPTESSPNASERTQTFHGSEAPIPVAYGETPIGGLLFYAASNASNELILGFVVSEGELDSFLETRVGDKVMPDMGIVATTYTGTSTQTKDATLSGNDANWTSGLQGIAYAVLKFPPFSTAVESVNPMDVKFKVKGRKIKDPRTGVTAWSDNPAMILADVLMAERFGAGIPESKMDFGAAGTWATAANDCDFDVDPGAPVIKRYTFNGVLREQESIEGVIEGIRAHFMGYVIFNNGSYQCFVDKQRAASGITFTDATPATANIIGVPEITVRGFSEVPSKVIVEFANKSKDYQDDSAEAELPGIVFGQSDFKRERRYRLYAVTTYDQAKRIAVHILNRGTQDKAIKFKTFAEGVRALPMDRIQVTSVVGLTAVDFLVTDSFQDGIAWVIEGESYADATYSDTIQTQVQPLSPQLPDPYTAPPNPTSVTLTTITETSIGGHDAASGLIGIKVKIAWVNGATPFYRTTRITVNDSANTFELGDFPNSPVHIDVTRAGQLYTVTLKTVNTVNKVSSGVSAQITPLDDPLISTMSSPTPVSAADATRIWWDGASNVAVLTRFGASFWSQVGLTGFVAANVQDGNLAVTAFTIPTGAGTKNLTLDLGVGQTRQMVGFRITGLAQLSSDAGGVVGWVSGEWQWSDNGTTFTAVSSYNTNLDLAWHSFDEKEFCHTFSVSPASHRWWRLTFTGDPGISVAITEIDFFQEVVPPGGLDPEIRYYEIWDRHPVWNNNIQLVATVDAASRPFSSSRTLDISAALHANATLLVYVSVFPVDIRGRRGVDYRYKVTTQQTIGLPQDPRARIQTGSTTQAGEIHVTKAKFGAGNLSADGQLHVCSEASADPRGIVDQQSTTDVSGSLLSLRKSRGTVGAKTAIVTGDTIGEANARGWDGSAWADGGRIRFVSEGTIAAAKVPTRIAFETMNDAGSFAERMRISGAGNVKIGIGAVAWTSLNGLIVALGANSYVQVSDGTRSTFIGADTAGCIIGAGSNHDLIFLANNIARLFLKTSGTINAPAQPRARAFHTFAQVVATSVWTSLTFNSENYNVQAIHDTATNNSRFTVPAGGDGLYLLVGGANFNVNATGERFMRIFKNGITAIAEVTSVFAPSGVNTARMQTVDVHALVAGDYIEFQVLQTSGANLNTLMGTDFTFGLVAKLW